MHLIVHWCGFSQLQMSSTILSALPEHSGGTDGFQLSAFHICHADLSGVKGKEVGFQLVFVRKFLITCSNGLCPSLQPKHLKLFGIMSMYSALADLQLCGDVTCSALS